MISFNNSDYKYIIYKVKDNIAQIHLNRPKKLNALKYPLLMEIIEVIEKIKKDKLIRVVTIQGNGSNFSSGDDLKSMGPDGIKFKPLEDGSKLPHHKVIKLLRELPKPVIAKIEGYCLGAGFELALACDFRLAADNIKMGDHRVNRAHCVMSGASWMLPRLIGLARATEIILTGKLLNAKEALEIGLVNRVYPINSFEKESGEFTKHLANLPTKCIGINKSMLNYSQKNDLFPSLMNEFKLYCKNIATYDFGEGMRSFREKRDPKYKGK
ncbi:MAG: enoyl-CoA hydratase/isomerase family protein [Candidatus Thorarchaeota archaeon]